MNSTNTTPIWDGNPNGVSGSTSLGVFDNDLQFQTDAPKIAKFIAKRLGYPQVAVELDSGSIYDSIEESILEYSRHVNEYNIKDNLINLQGASTGSNLTQKYVTHRLSNVIELSEAYGTELGVGGDVDWKTGSISITANRQDYDLDALWTNVSESGNTIKIKQVHHYRKPASQRYYDPMIGNQQLLDEFGFGNMGAGTTYMLAPMQLDLLRMQSIEFSDKIRRSDYSFEIINNKLKLFPIPESDDTLHFRYVVETTAKQPISGTSGDGKVSDMSTAPYNNMIYTNINDVGKQWIRKYAVEIARDMLGQIRSKFGGIRNSDGSDLQLNGADLTSQAQQEKERLITELREMLDTMTRRSQLEKQSEESEFLQQQLSKFPTLIYLK